LAPLRDSDLAAVPYYHDIRQALAQPGCAFCHLLAQSAERYLDGVLWEQVNDPEVRSELNLARGYCHEHGWLLVRAGASLGVAILTRGVIKALLDVADSTPVQPGPLPAMEGLRKRLRPGFSSTSAAGLLEALSPQSPCPACAIVRDREQKLADTLLAHLEAPGSLAEAFAGGDGLCLAHLRSCLKRSTSPARTNLLLTAQRQVWQRLYEELGEFIRKSDHRFRHETFGAEADAWRRALEVISGPVPRSPEERRALTQAHRRSAR
jgi:hypothetical protein